MLVTLLMLLVCVVGLIVFLVAEKPKTSEAGRLAYMWALIALLWCSCGGGDVLEKLLLRK